MIKGMGWLLLLTLLFSVDVTAQSKIDSLIFNGQYLSAYEYVNNVDSLSIDMALKKVDIAINYHLNCQYFREFSFVNLRKGESLSNLRLKAGYGATPIKFDVDSFLQRLHSDYPTDHRVSKVLGDFYNKVYYDFGDSWGERSEVLLEKSNSYYLQAFENGVYDYYSLYALGYYQSLNENYFDAQRWLLKSLKLKPDEDLTNYSLAVTYLFDGLPQKGIRYAERAYELYSDSLSKSDAARITGILHLKTQQLNEAKVFFEKANELHPQYRPNQMYLLKVATELGDDSLSVKLAKEVLMAEKYSPELAEEMNSLFLQVDKIEWLCQVYDEVLEIYSADSEVCGNIRFHYGKLLYKNGQKREARKMVKQSRKDFEMVFESNHQVFDAIEQTLARIK
ncbi:tetratricopeptide repeat protein [Carboxylicivirga marina]|uniref:tetratricopeptide repeat protein n=1 Tax=Carboxylicivirga marina TaxID=2800988 RepID=UPI0025943CDE|nr:hypothetical protein [uncultured Carboxylicivirga sp.]